MTKKSIYMFFSAIIGSIFTILIMGENNKKVVIKELLVSNKYFKSFRVMNQWIKVKQDGKNLSEYFEKLDYQKIAVYGMGYIGETLVNELKSTKTKVEYGIDQNAISLYSNIDIVSPEDELQQVDVIVVTLVNSFDKIQKMLQKKITCPIISIVEVVFDI